MVHTVDGKPVQMLECGLRWSKSKAVKSFELVMTAAHRRGIVNIRKKDVPNGESRYFSHLHYSKTQRMISMEIFPGKFLGILVP